MNKQELNTVIIEIKNALDEKEYDKVVKICSDEEYIQDRDIQHFMIIALMRAEKYEEALVKVNEFLGQGYNARLESKKINLIKELYGLEAALKECKEVEYKKDSTVYYSEASILFDLGRFDEALALCEKCKEADGQYRDMFLSLKNKIRRFTCPEAVLLTKISVNRIETKEIESANIEKWEKFFLIVAYYSRLFSKPNAFYAAKKMKTAILDEIDEMKKNATTDEEKRAADLFEISKRQLASNTYNLLLPQKFRPIPMSFFEEGLDCKINPYYAEELKNMKKEKKEKPKKEEKKPEVKVEQKKEEPKEEKKIISSIGNVVNNRYNNTNKVSDINIKNNKDKFENMLIKDYYREETIMLGKYLYACMHNNEIREEAIQAYDKLMTMVYKPVSDTKTLTRFVDLLRRIDHAKEIDTLILDTNVVEFDISMGTVENKYEKVIK